MKTVEDGIKELFVRMAKRSKTTPRLAMWPDGVLLTEKGESKFFTWDEWEARQS